MKIMLHRVRKNIALARNRIHMGYYYNDVESYQQQDADVFVISFPKSGRTWLRMMFGKYLCLLYGQSVEDKRLLETYELTRNFPGTPVVAFIHDGSSYHVHNYSVDEIETNKKRYKDKKVILLARDPRDTVVSYYFHCTSRAPVFNGPLSAFIRDTRFGIDKIIRFLNIWVENQHTPRAFAILRYEDIHQNPEQELSGILEFTGLAIDPGILKPAIEYASFSSMQNLERNQKLNSNRLAPRDINDLSSYKVRRGKVGGYVDYLSEEDIAYVNGQVNNNLAPVLGYSSATSPKNPTSIGLLRM